MTERPTYRGSVPKGHHVVAVVDEDWRIPFQQKKCRRLVDGVQCPAPAVAELDRGKAHWKAPRPNWWAYCPEHMYGRWVENGQVMNWRIEADHD